MLACYGNCMYVEIPYTKEIQMKLVITIIFPEVSDHLLLSQQRLRNLDADE